MNNTTPRIGWLGTGRMGTAMASRLLDDGANLVVWNRTAAKTASLVDRGATRADTIQDLTACDVVFVSVTSSPDLLEVTLDSGGLLSGEVTPRIIVDTSTASPEAGAHLRTEAERCGTAVVAAPIGANPDMVAEGAAAIAASGPTDEFDQVRPHLEAIARTVVYCGANEEARLVKLGHNLLLGITTQALAEATVLAEKGGVTPADFLDFIDGSVLGSTFIHHKGQAIRARDYQATFTTENLRKDFDLLLAAARTLDVALPVGATVDQLIQTAIGHGHRDEDYVSLYEVAARAAGVTHRE